jgi:hypothetical protein
LKDFVKDFVVVLARCYRLLALLLLVTGSGSSAHAAPHLEVQAADGDMAPVYTRVQLTVAPEAQIAESGVSYEFWAEREGRRTMLRGPSPAATYTWIPAAPGVYRLGASIRDAQARQPIQVLARHTITIVAVRFRQHWLVLGQGSTLPVTMTVTPPAAAQRVRLESLDPAVAVAGITRTALSPSGVLPRGATRHGGTRHGGTTRQATTRQTTSTEATSDLHAQQFFISGIKPGVTAIQAKLGNAVCRGFYVNVFSPRLRIDGAVLIPGSVPPTWVATISGRQARQNQDAAASEGSSSESDARVLIEVDLEPFAQAGVFSPKTASPRIIWKGGSDAGGELHERRSISTTRSGVTAVSVTVNGARAALRVVVLRVERLEPASPSLLSVDRSHAVTATSARFPLCAVRAVITPQVPHLDAVLPSLLHWNGGVPARTPHRRWVCRDEPGKTSLTVRCGDSSAVLTAWAVRATLERIDSVVRVGDEPTPVSLMIEPSEAGGLARLDVSRAPRLRLLQAAPGAPLGRTKPMIPRIEQTMVQRTWHLNHTAVRPAYGGPGTKAQLIPSSIRPPTLFCVTAWPPGRAPEAASPISRAKGHALQTLALNYEWGPLHLQRKVSFRIEPRAGASRVALRLYPAVEKTGGGNSRSRGRSLVPAAFERSGLIGGRRFVALEVTIAPGEQMDSRTLPRLFLRIAEDSPRHAPGTACYDVPLALSESVNWQQSAGRQRVGQSSSWQPARLAPVRIVNRGQTPIVLRRLVFWDTAHRPLGHNGLHSVSLVTAGGQPYAFTFGRAPRPDSKAGSQQGALHPYRVSAVRQRVDVQNLVITEVMTSDGSHECMRYDPEDERPALSKPSLRLRFADAAYRPGDSYRCTVTFLDLNSVATAVWSRTLHRVPRGAMRVPVQPTMERSLWGFDVVLTKLRAGEVLDTERWLSEYLTFGETAFEMAGEGLQYGYRINGQAGARAASQVRVQQFDGAYDSGPPGDGATSLHIRHTAVAPEGSGAAGEGAVIIMGRDNEGARYRDHRNRYILPERSR